MWCDNCHCENFESLEVVSVERRLIDEYYVEHVQYEISILTIKCKECGHIFTEVY